MLTINEKSTAVETGDDFCIPRGKFSFTNAFLRSWYRLHDPSEIANTLNLFKIHIF